MGIVRGKLVFIDNSVLDFMELMGTGCVEYRFHYMTKNSKLISRWDSAPHHKEVATFPYHVHTLQGVKESKKVHFVEILEIITERVLENLKL